MFLKIQPKDSKMFRSVLKNKNIETSPFIFKSKPVFETT